MASVYYDLKEITIWSIAIRKIKWKIIRQGSKWSYGVNSEKKQIVRI